MYVGQNVNVSHRYKYLAIYIRNVKDRTMTNEDLVTIFRDAIVNDSVECLPTGRFILDVVITDGDISVVVIDARED